MAARNQRSSKGLGRFFPLSSGIALLGMVESSSPRVLPDHSTCLGLSGEQEKDRISQDSTPGWNSSHESREVVCSYLNCARGALGCQQIPIQTSKQNLEMFSTIPRSSKASAKCLVMFWVSTDGTRRAGTEINLWSHWEPRVWDKSLTAGHEISSPSCFSTAPDGEKKRVQFCPGSIWVKFSCWISGGKQGNHLLHLPT